MVRTSRTNKVCCSRSCRTYKVKHTTSACNRKITPSVYRKERCRVTISFMQSANFCHVRWSPAEPSAAGPANQSGPGGPAARRPGRGDPRSSRPLPPAGSPPRGAGRRQWVARWLFLALRAGVPCRQRFRLRQQGVGGSGTNAPGGGSSRRCSVRRIFPKAMSSIWRTRSRLTPHSCPASSNVRKGLNHADALEFRFSRWNRRVFSGRGCLRASGWRPGPASSRPSRRRRPPSPRRPRHRPTGHAAAGWPA